MALEWRWLGLAIAAAGLTGCMGGRLVRYPSDINGANPNSLNSGFAERSPHLAGSYLVFVSDRRGSQDIYLYNLRSRQSLPLPGLNSLDTITSSPSVSDDGQWVAFAASRQGRSRILVYNTRTRQISDITGNLPAEVRSPMISADGRRITFEVNRNGQWDIALFTRQGQPINLP
ncbi:MAG: Tol biopolymer transporter periplasmic protein [Cyanobacteria bacterium P01_F01_bin.153]